jgi:hypothetical protein
MADQESNDLESYIKDDASNESEDASSLLDQSSDLNESDSSSDLLGEDNETSSSSLADDIEEANASILTADPDPFNKQNFEKLTSTLSSIETKIDNEKEQLKKLDVLDDIKTEIQKMNENSLMQSTNSSPSVGHNLPGTSELLSRVEELESKIQNNTGGGVSDEIQESINDLLSNVQKLNAATNTYNKRFEKIEETVSRFEEMEKDIQLEYIDDEEEIDTSTKAVSSKDKKRQNILYLILIGLIMTITGLVILDRLKIVDLYLDEILKSFF